MMHLLMQSTVMRTTVTIDDDLYDQAVALADPGMEKADLFRECVRAFIQRQTGRRLAALGGQAPDIDLAPRRREGEKAPAA